MGGSKGLFGSLSRAAVNPIKHAQSDESFLNVMTPPAPVAPPPPAPAPAAPADPAGTGAAAASKAAEDERKKRVGQGRASTVLTSPLGSTGDDYSGSARKVLLGQ